MEGDVKVRSLDATWRDAQVGAEVAPGVDLSTETASSVTLVRGADSITVAPGSEMTVGEGTASNDAPSIIQTIGTLLFRIDSREGIDRFRVRTPFLAAVIKGTVFSVSVTPEGSALHVTEGLVEVASVATGQSGLVAVGQTARVSAQPGSGLSIGSGGGQGAPGSNPDNNSNGDPKQKSDAAPGQQNGEPARAAQAGEAPGRSATASGRLKIGAAIDTGIGDVAASTGGLVSQAGKPDSAGKAATGNGQGGNNGRGNGRGSGGLGAVGFSSGNVLAENSVGNGNGNNGVGNGNNGVGGGNNGNGGVGGGNNGNSGVGNNGNGGVGGGNNGNGGGGNNGNGGVGGGNNGNSGGGNNGNGGGNNGNGNNGNNGGGNGNGNGNGNN